MAQPVSAWALGIHQPCSGIGAHHGVHGVDVGTAALLEESRMRLASCTAKAARAVGTGVPAGEGTSNLHFLDFKSLRDKLCVPFSCSSWGQRLGRAELCQAEQSCAQPSRPERPHPVSVPLCWSQHRVQLRLHGCATAPPSPASRRGTSRCLHQANSSCSHMDPVALDRQRLATPQSLSPSPNAPQTATFPAQD